jgi:hypothetical protein
MNKKKLLGGLRQIVATVLTLLPGVPQSAMAGPPEIPPVHSFPFDASRGDSTLSIEVQIREYRNYQFALQFDYAGESDLLRVLKLVGQSNEAGVILPVHLKVLRNQPGANPETIYEESVETKSQYAHGFSEIKFHGNYRRMIAVVALKPGLYRVHVNTMRESPEFAGTPSHFKIEWHPNIRPLAE